MENERLLITSFEELPYHAELEKLEKEVPLDFAASPFLSCNINQLPFPSAYLEGKRTTMEHLGVLAEYGVARTWDLYMNKQEENKDLSPCELADKLRKAMYAAGETKTCSERILDQLHIYMNEQERAILIPNTHKIFTRMTKLIVCNMALKYHKTHGRDFLRFFRAFHPSWRFDRAFVFLGFIAVSKGFL